jgi:hypothetical protein
LTRINARGVPARLLLALILSGIAIAALSVVPAWLFHDRFMGGHGLTSITVLWNAWQGRAWPFLPGAAILAVLVALLAALELARPGTLNRWWLTVPSVALLALLAASALPLYRAGYASVVHLTPSWALLVAVGLGVVMVAGLAALLRGRALLFAVAGLIVLVAAGYGGRVLALDLAEGNPRHWSDGAYERAAVESVSAETLTIANGAYRVDERWSGGIEGRGLVAVLTDDPACPGDRGAYRVFADGEDGIRFELIVDLCADGGRAADMTRGVWRRPK